MEGGSENINELKTLAARIARKIIFLKNERVLAVDSTHKFKLAEEIEELEQELETLKEQIEAARAAAPPAPAPLLFHEYHCHTCDRIDQYDHFHKDFLENKSRKKTHYYYIYGGDPHSHRGLFRRLAYGLEGALLDYLSPSLDVSCSALKVEVTFDASHDIAVYKHNIVKSLFAAFNIPVNEQEPLLDKNVNDLLAHSPRLRGLCYKDYACIFLSISEWDWDARITPLVTRWLIESFWEKPVPETAPVFLLFFGVMYEEGNRSIEKEVQKAVKKSAYIRELPQLDMVSRDDVKKWLAKYHRLAPTSRARREWMESYFSAAGDYYMEDVEEALLRIIAHYNNQRNS